jgi:hypothetical protein
MIDRKARDAVAQAIRAFMREEITACQLDDALTEASKATDDKVVQMTVQALWYHYDDFKDHMIVASKVEWDYFNRLLLLLESDGEIETVKSGRIWHPLQALAGVLLLSFIVIAMRAGWGEHLFAYALPFGPPSMALAWLNDRRWRCTHNPIKAALTPFSSISSLLSIRRRVVHFERIRYPNALAGRRIRTPMSDMLMRVPGVMLWCLFSPLVLLLQTLPETASETRIN